MLVARGALLVAAAGNTSGGQSDAGLLLPAAWVEINAPSQAECDLHQAGTLSAGMDLLTAPNHYNSSKFPLIIPASGLTRDGSDITNQRDGARVKYATYADTRHSRTSVNPMRATSQVPTIHFISSLTPELQFPVRFSQPSLLRLGAMTQS